MKNNVNLMDYVFAGGSIVSSNYSKEETPVLLDYPGVNVHHVDDLFPTTFSKLLPNLLVGNEYYLVYFIKNNSVSGISFIDIKDFDITLETDAGIGNKLLFILDDTKTKYQFVHGSFNGYFTLLYDTELKIDQPAFKSPYLVPNYGLPTKLYAGQIQ